MTLGLLIEQFRELGEDLGGIDRQRTIHKDRDAAAASRGDHLVQIVDEFLGAPDRKGGDDDLAAALEGAQNTSLKFSIGFGGSRWVLSP